MKQKNVYTYLLTELENKLNIIPDKSDETPINTLHSLWHLVSGTNLSHISAEKHELKKLTEDQIKQLEKLIYKRLNNTPLAHITKRQHFLGLDFILKEGIYIPRKDTELVAKTAISVIKDYFFNSDNIKIIDVCTGIGTLGIAIANQCINTQIYGSDIYAPAIELAQINSEQFRLLNRTNFYTGDLFEPFSKLGLEGKTQIIVSAPPYISTKKAKNLKEEISNHEPIEAFDAGSFGLSIFTKLISESTTYMKNNGFLIFECGSGQGDFLVKRLKLNPNYKNVKGICDNKNEIRVILAQKA